jgi:tetratricopeptide (TPR) repeat protein
MRAVGLINVGELNLSLGRLDQAEQLLKQIPPLLDRLAQKQSRALKEQLYLPAMSQLTLGKLYFQTRRLALAEESLRKSFLAYEQLARDFPRVPDYPVYLMLCYDTLSDLLKGDPRAALDLTVRAIPVMEGWLKQNEKNPLARQALCVMLGTRALDGWTRMGQYKEALADWERALEVDRGQVRPLLLLGRACTWAHQGEHEKALEVVATVNGKGVVSGDQHFLAARVAAVASVVVLKDTRLLEKECGKLAERYASQAVTFLKQTVGAELHAFKEEARADHLRKDPDFVPLLSRADFQKVLTELEMQSKTPPPK